MRSLSAPRNDPFRKTNSFNCGSANSQKNCASRQGPVKDFSQQYPNPNDISISTAKEVLRTEGDIIENQKIETYLLTEIPSYGDYTPTPLRINTKNMNTWAACIAKQTEVFKALEKSDKLQKKVRSQKYR